MGWLAVSAVVVALVDQGAKRVAADGQPVVNRRAALVALPARTAIVIWAGAVGCVAAVTLAGPALPPGGAIGVGLSIGGATSNLADRIARGGVLDHIRVGRWPAFNVADAALAAGVLVAAASLL